MDFELKPEQEQLRDMLQRYVRKDYAFEARRRIIASPEGFSRDAWATFAELGLTGIGIPEEHGGIGGDAVDLFVVMESLGTGLVVEPYLATVVLGAGLVRDAGSGAQKEAILPAVARGQMFLALAHFEPGGRFDIEHVATTAKRSGPGYVLKGSKAVVLAGEAADKLIVSAATQSGVSLFLVDAKAKGVSRKGYPTRDGQRAADLALDDVAVDAAARIGNEGEGLAHVERAVDAAIAALCAEAVGCMDALNAHTLEYLKTRKQFGVAIGTFQVLKHRMADMFIAAAQARSMAYLAVLRADDADRARRRRAISAAKALVGKSARVVGQGAVQLHGGMGVVDELIVSHYFKRLTAINTTFGDADHHLARYSDLLAAEEEVAEAPPKSMREVAAE
jgi:alkylation response protein AidB-like acyl-CoA dehydrogenase